MTPRPLLDALDARLGDPVRPGHVHTEAGALRWDADGVWLGEARLDAPAVQLSRDVTARRAGRWRRLWMWWQAPRVFVELRAGRHRVRLCARMPRARLEGLPELPLTPATPLPAEMLLDLVCAARAHDGRLVQAPRHAQLTAPPPVPELADDAPEPEPESEPPVPRLPWRQRVRRWLAARPRLAGALRAWPLWLYSLPVFLLPLLVPAYARAPWPPLEPLSWRVLAPLAWAVLPWIAGGLFAAYKAMRGRLDVYGAGQAAGFGIGLTTLLMASGAIIWSVVHIEDAVAGWFVTVAALLTVAFVVRRRLETDWDAEALVFACLLGFIPGPQHAFMIVLGSMLTTELGGRLADPETHAALEREREAASKR